MCDAHCDDPRPLYFGRESRPLFGWLHPCNAGQLGLVICNPFGDESVRAHRSVRHLAIAASKAGFPALRFDYDGTGDSCGHDLEPERVTEWLASIHAAADALREQTGVTQVCFLGIRLGATLAALAAATRTDTAGLLAIAPVVSGKAYLRELRMFQRAIDSKRNIVGSDAADTLESAGFLLSESTQAELAALDLVRMESRPAPRVLILDRAEMPAAEKWAQRLRALDAQVDYSPAHGYAEMMLENHESIVPEAIIKAAIHWLRELAASFATTSTRYWRRAHQLRLRTDVRPRATTNSRSQLSPYPRDHDSAARSRLWRSRRSPLGTPTGCLASSEFLNTNRTIAAPSFY